MVQKIKAYIKRHYKLTLPFAFVAASVVLVTGHIPYVNQYAQEFILLVLFTEWLVLAYVTQISRETTIKVILGLFVFSFGFTLLGLTFYSEVIGNFIFALLALVSISILREKNHEK